MASVGGKTQRGWNAYMRHILVGEDKRELREIMRSKEKPTSITRRLDGSEVVEAYVRGPSESGWCSVRIPSLEKVFYALPEDVQLWEENAGKKQDGSKELSV